MNTDYNLSTNEVELLTRCFALLLEIDRRQKAKLQIPHEEDSLCQGRNSRHDNTNGGYNAR